MQDILNKAYDKYAQTGSAPSSLHTDLLCDPDLVEDYSDVLKTMPMKLRQDEENSSVNGSVVMSPGSAPGSPEKKWTARPSKTAIDEESTQRSGTQSGQQRSNLGSTRDEASNSEYEYSDSEFEEDMENRLQDLTSGSQRNSGMELLESKASPAEDLEPSSRVERFSDSDSISDEDDLTTSRPIAASQEQFANMEASDENNDQEDEIDEDFQPLAPPEEIDPGKLYALYPFQGPDPSHCQLYQDEGCILLNDQDAYWWLVKRCSDGKIGFAPAEILETYPERLARLNCWKNENMSGHSVGSANSAKGEGSTPSDHPEHSKDLYKKGNKSVSFNDVVSYAERYSRDEDSEDNASGSEDLDATDKDERMEGTGGALVGRIYEAALLNEDDASEVVSDVSSNQGSTLPLQVSKVRKVVPESAASRKYQDPKADSTDTQLTKTGDSQSTSVHSDYLKVGDDELYQIFKAPSIPFADHKEMQNSNSNYSISTIGDYSPSSSEWTNDSPQVNVGVFEASDNTVEGIPSTKAIKDISKLVSSSTNENHDPSYAMEHVNSADMNTSTEDSPANDLAVNLGSSQTPKRVQVPSYLANDEPEDNSQQAKVRYGLLGAHKTISNQDRGQLRSAHGASQSSVDYSASHRESTSASSDDSCIGEGRATSATTINSTLSFGESKFSHHPTVYELYNPLFGKIDTLLQKLDNFMIEES
ncbi:LADA_0D12464g1_1 [Lachancea dasiensis]|uniref:LADA_0D12464g1_1 n=1 Tax=Lachancea dasiensis TaxID=1072105 RepID=A0A1G4J8E8_9SACH|nr:LADA_0D12464g1_1 [Lachancea dasiensis]